MGGGASTSFLESGTGVIVHHPKRNKLTRHIVKGGFNAGPKTMDKIRTRSDFSLLKLLEEENTRNAFKLWTMDNNYTEASYHLDFVLDVDSMKQKKKRSKIAEIYHQYIPPQVAKKLVPLDQTTRWVKCDNFFLQLQQKN